MSQPHCHYLDATTSTTDTKYPAILTNNSLVDGVGGDEAINDDGSLLSDSMGSILGL